MSDVPSFIGASRTEGTLLTGGGSGEGGLCVGIGANNSSCSPGKNSWIRSHVSVHSWECDEESDLSGGASNTPAVDMTSSIFFRDSGMDSAYKYNNNIQYSIFSTIGRKETYQKLTAIYMHEVVHVE